MLPDKPLGGKLGEEIQRKICAPCYAEWEEMQVIILNEYRLNLAIPQHYEVLIGEMRRFLNLDGSPPPDQSGTP